MALLEVKQLSKTFGGLEALKNFELSLEKKELVGLIGPNGAGKTTVFNLLTGVYKPTSGTFYLEGKCLLGLKPHQITSCGIARTFQNIRLFGDLSVFDNVRVANHWYSSYPVANAVLRLPSYFKYERRMSQRAYELLEIFNLLDKKDELAKNLPYGEQRRLEIARALAAKPKVLLLDEPAAGMNPLETKELMNLISWIREEFNLTILLIEHDMSLVMGICERIIVLDHGEIIAQGTPEEIKRNPRVIGAYLGEEAV
ncbi:MAG TPA: high-affinity branched-chain amino acid ABC transporter ATP-binding protein LivG [Peptococcaceae bacterium]|nr:MAG: Amino acid/amide ABC transporter ATP-binding protein 1, HAAT family [Clostridia bacterium 41_269]HBT20241.1 high-affinity branched-chain amino acid ABC transporter ATP-binding protein LivG [Peptococcaceae bacterium]